MTLWEFSVVVDGWNKAHASQQKPDPMSDAEFDTLVEQGAARMM